MSDILYSLIDMKSVESRSENTLTPQKLVGDAEDALQEYLGRNLFSEVRTYKQLFKATEAAYKAITADPELGSQYEKLLDDTVCGFPWVENGRVSIEKEKEKYRIHDFEAIWDGCFMLTSPEVLQDALLLLKKVVSPKEV